MATYLIGNIKGPKGADGISPTASVEQTSTGATITITDATGTTTATIRNGVDGDGNNIDLTPYATKTEVAETYASKAYVDSAVEAVDAPVTSVNGMVGAVTITETDPTVPAWAKQPNKPAYTAQEVGALPASTYIPTVPTNVSSFTNDADYVDSTDLATALAGKQDTLTAGANIDITNGVISADLPADELPTISSGDAGKVLSVNSTETGVEWTTPSGSGNSDGIFYLDNYVTASDWESVGLKISEAALDNYNWSLLPRTVMSKNIIFTMTSISEFYQGGSPIIQVVYSYDTSYPISRNENGKVPIDLGKQFVCFTVNKSDGSISYFYRPYGNGTVLTSEYVDTGLQFTNRFLQVNTNVIATRQYVDNAISASGGSSFSGDYDDLTNKPDLSVYAESADLATVATTGDYDDLSNKPTIPVLPTLATVATSGSYTDLSDKPTIPTYTAGVNIDITNGEISLVDDVLIESEPDQVSGEFNNIEITAADGISAAQYDGTHPDPVSYSWLNGSSVGAQDTLYITDDKTGDTTVSTNSVSIEPAGIHIQNDDNGIDTNIETDKDGNLRWDNSVILTESNVDDYVSGGSNITTITVSSINTSTWTSEQVQALVDCFVNGYDVSPCEINFSGVKYRYYNKETMTRWISFVCEYYQDIQSAGKFIPKAISFRINTDLNGIMTYSNNTIMVPSNNVQVDNTTLTNALNAKQDALPALTNNAGKVLTVNSGATGLEWTTPASGGSSLPADPSNDGTYFLTTTVSSGTATQAWVSVPNASGNNF